MKYKITIYGVKLTHYDVTTIFDFTGEVTYNIEADNSENAIKIGVSYLREKFKVEFLKEHNIKIEY